MSIFTKCAYVCKNAHMCSTYNPSQNFFKLKNRQQRKESLIFQLESDQQSSYIYGAQEMKGYFISTLFSTFFTVIR